MTTASGGRVIDVRTGEALELNADEVALLGQAVSGGFDPGDPEANPVFRKFSNLGLLVAAAPSPVAVKAPPPRPPPVQPVVPRAPTPDTIVPMMRSDLVISKGSTGGLFDVKDPVSGQVHPLHDFELSLGRMLDGRRTFAEMIEAAGKLGIPVSIDGLGLFIRRLAQYRFLADAASSSGPPPPPGTTWPARDEWNESTRGQFQAALRESRQGNYAASAQLLEAILAKDPKNTEAAELLEVVRQLSSGAKNDEANPPPAPPPESWDPVPLPVLSSPFPAPGFPVLPAVAPTIPPLAAAGAAPSVAPAIPPMGAPPPPPGPEASSDLPPTKVAAATLEDLATVPDATSARVMLEEEAAGKPPPPPDASIFEDLPEVGAPGGNPPPIAAASPSPIIEAAVRLPSTSVPGPARSAERPASDRPARPSRLPLILGGFAALLAATGAGWYLGVEHARSEQPAVARTDPRPEPHSAQADASAAVVVAADAASAQVDPGTAKMLDASSPALAIAAGPALDASTAAPEKAPDASTPAPPTPVVAVVADAGIRAASSEVKVGKRGRVTMGTVVAPSAGTVTWKVAPQQQVKRGEVVGTFRGESEEVPLVAPKAGLVIPAIADQAQAKAGDTLASILYFEAFIQATVKGAQPQPTWSCEVFDVPADKSAPCKVVSAVPRGDGFFLTATTEPMWFDTSTEPRLRLIPR